MCSGYWIQWAAFASLWFFLIVCDYMFLSDNLFIYDPAIKVPVSTSPLYFVFSEPNHEHVCHCAVCFSYSPLCSRGQPSRPPPGTEYLWNERQADKQKWSHT